VILIILLRSNEGIPACLDSKEWKCELSMWATSEYEILE